MAAGGEHSERILVVAPIGRDAELLVQALTSAGLTAFASTTIERFYDCFDEGCAAVLLTEEALTADPGGQLFAAVAKQPTWSEVPFVILTSRGQAEDRVRLTASLIAPLRNATVIERPVRPRTIVTAMEGALRDRKRQYEVRDAMDALRLANQDLEKRVEQRTSDLVAKIEELEGFCYSVSHDMRTPLRAIVSNASIVLEDESEVSQEGRERLERLSAASLRMAHLVDDLLQYARLGASEPRKEDCDLTALVRRVADEALFERPEQETTITVQEGMRGQCDSRLIGLVIHNLIDNAIKYQPHDHPVHVHAGQSPEGIYFVRDNGIGFENQYAAKIFQPFERLHRDGDYSGTGIGLANVQRIVNRHGGRVWAEGSPDRGATIWFTLS